MKRSDDSFGKQFFRNSHAARSRKHDFVAEWGGHDGYRRWVTREGSLECHIQVYWQIAWIRGAPNLVNLVNLGGRRLI